MHKQTDIELITQSLNGNHAAYGELVARYKNSLYRHCFAIMRNEDAAEDIAQEAFVTAYFKLKLYNSDYKFSTWLFKIGTNKALNALRKSSKESLVDESFFDQQASTLPGPKEHTLLREAERAIERLKPKYRAVVRLYYYEGIRYADIAVTLGVSVGTIKSWLYRAKAQLRKELL